MAKIKLEDIQAEIQPDGWKVISDAYTNLKTEMVFQCPEGHKVYANWEKLRAKRECPVCNKNTYKIECAENTIIKKKKGTFRVLALDQATYITGFAIFDDKKLVKYGKFCTNEDQIIARIHEVKIWLMNMINNIEPDLIAIEGIQLQDNKEKRMGVTTFQDLAWLQGVLLECAHELNVQCEICHTATWRNHCKVKGRSRTDKKRSMQLIAKTWFDISVSEDEADAIGIGKYAADNFTKKLQLSSWE